MSTFQAQQSVIVGRIASDFSDCPLMEKCAPPFARELLGADSFQIIVTELLSDFSLNHVSGFIGLKLKAAPDRDYT